MEGRAFEGLVRRVAGAIDRHAGVAGRRGRHSHDTYSFGVTEEGSQAFACRHSAHVSTTGLVMAFNPDEPHDGHASDRAGFTYRMVHIEPGYFSELLGTGSPWPLFREPVIDDSSLASAVTRLHTALTAVEAGFADQAHLTRWFRRCYGITPAAFRKATMPVLPHPIRS